MRQPENDDELAAAINSTAVCCVLAIRYGGRDRAIIRRLHNDPDVCDYIVGDDGGLSLTVDDKGDLLPFAQRIVDERGRKKLEKKWWQFWR